MKTRVLSLLFLLSFFVVIKAQTDRAFKHPGITYTKGDIDRMKAMIQAKREPYYSTFLALLSSPYSSCDIEVMDRGNKISSGKFNGTIGIDGRRAIDLALLWHLTDEDKYAQKAVEILNANSHYTNTSACGTGPLDNGKIYLLIEAAELMRDYSEWKAEDQDRFKKMLVHPGYSNTEDLFSKYGNYYDESLNNVTFYWNIYNFDAGRFGNQGLFAARGMMAMGIYLDNEIMYERAYRYLLGMKHRSDDLPYPSGPALKSDEPFKKTSAIWDYKPLGRSDEIADYGYDEQLQYYIYPNGQCQESSRDQGHVLAGLHNYVAIAEMAWNQGDSLYSCLDNRILLGLEWNYRYNLSAVRSYPDQLKPWEPVYVTTDISEVSYENNKYLSILSRSGRWRSMSISAHGRGDGAKSGGTREMALAHYSVRANVDSIKYKWLERYRDHMIEKYGMEDWGVAPNWFYEWTGWGTLTKRLTPWMAGDPGKFKNREHISGINQLPGVINVVDYDYYCKSENPEGHTCHNSNKKIVVNDYRPDGNVEISKDGDDYVVLNIQDGEWMNYTVSVPETADYKVFLSYSCEGSANVTLVSDQGISTGKCLINKNNYNDIEVSKIHLNAGACVLRLIINETSNNLKIKRLKIVK